MTVCFILLLIASFFLWGSEPIGFVTIENPEKYLLTNKYVTNLLDGEEKVVLPTAIPECGEQEYYYYYGCGFMGYPNVVIYLSLQFASQTEFEEQIDRLVNMEPYGNHQIDGLEYYIFSKIYQPNLELYFDDIVYDGVVDKFQVAVVNREIQQIEYLYAFIRTEPVRPNQVVHIMYPLFENDLGIQPK